MLLVNDGYPSSNSIVIALIHIPLVSRIVVVQTTALSQRERATPLTLYDVTV